MWTKPKKQSYAIGKERIESGRFCGAAWFPYRPGFSRKRQPVLAVIGEMPANLRFSTSRQNFSGP